MVPRMIGGRFVNVTIEEGEDSRPNENDFDVDTISKLIKPAK